MDPLFTGAEWDFSLLDQLSNECEKIATEELKLDCYPNQFEIISAAQMLDAYSSVGMPILYPHWSFGKHRSIEENHYTTGKNGLAYEIVINSNPCISYLMEENTATLQALVIAHAGFGHNSFFKNNYLFREWTNADFIIDYLSFAKKYIQQCEEEHGPSEVELVLDAAHSLQNNSIDKSHRPSKLTLEKEELRKKERHAYTEERIGKVWQTIPGEREKTLSDSSKKDEDIFPVQPEDNLLYFIEKYAPNLAPWKREVLRIVRKVGQYFYPQGLTKIMNEGWATFTHYYIMTRLHEKGLITDGAYLEFIGSHTNVIRQRPQSPFNPYAIGFAIFMDLKRICLTPTDEDREWFPSIAGQSDWVSVLQDAAYNYRDESFIRQFLSPKVMRDFNLFAIDNPSEEEDYEVLAISDDQSYKDIRKILADQIMEERSAPDLRVVNVDLKDSRGIKIKLFGDITLDIDQLELVAYYIESLWEYPVSIAI